MAEFNMANRFIDDKQPVVVAEIRINVQDD